MFRNFLHYLDNLDITIDANAPTLRDAFSQFIPVIEEALVYDLLDNAERAMYSIPEYAAPQAAPLRERLLDNLGSMRGDGYVHVMVSPNGDLYFFDEEFAGTEADFEDAKWISKHNQNPEMKRILWKYGIYKPSVEGASNETTSPRMRKAMQNLPTYEEVIERRLDIWEDKAPYWYFIENGNAGGGREYPSFSGTFFLRNFEKDAKRKVRKIFQDITVEYANAVGDNIERTGTENRPQPAPNADLIWVKVAERNGLIREQRFSRSIGRIVKGSRTRSAG
jgi:hypothetical protein